MTLTISQLQHMYGTKVYELKGRDVTPAPVVQRAANAAQEIIPAEDNPLFMSVEQRADAARTVQNVSQTPEEVKLATQNAVQDAKDREDPVIPEFDWKPEQSMLGYMPGDAMLKYVDDTSELRALRNMTPDERVTYQRSKRAQQAKEDAIAATLPPRPAGALGKDLRLNMADIEKATFLEDMKIKYSEYKDIIPQSHSSSLGGVIESPTQAQARVGNSFVITLTNAFYFLDAFYESVTFHEESIAWMKADQAADPSNGNFAEGIAAHQQAMGEKMQEYTKLMTNLKKFSEGFNVEQATQDFFADYTEFVTGKPINLKALYGELGIA